MSKSTSYIAVDLGAESGRAMVFAVEDGKVSVEEHHRFASKPVLLAGHMYWDIARIFDEVKAGVRKAALETGEVRSLAIDTWGVDFGFLSASGEPLGLPFAYRDHKNDGMIEIVREAMADDELYGLTGIQFMQLNTLYQLVALKRMGYPLLDCAAKLLFVPDLLNYLFSGQAVAEYTIASTSQLLDPVNKVWEKRIFDRLGLPLEIMPDIVESGADLGLVLPEQAEDMGIPRLRVRTCAGHDTGSAVVAVPALSDGKTWGFISAGTWCLVGLEVPKPVLGPDALAANVTNEGGVCNTIRLLKNVTGMWLVQRLRVDLEKRGVSMDYGELMEAAEAAPAFRRFINPNDPVFLNPPSMMAAVDEYARRRASANPTARPSMRAACSKAWPSRTARSSRTWRTSRARPSSASTSSAAARGIPSSTRARPTPAGSRSWPGRTKRRRWATGSSRRWRTESSGRSPRPGQRWRSPSIWGDGSRRRPTSGPPTTTASSTSPAGRGSRSRGCCHGAAQHRQLPVPACTDGQRYPDAGQRQAHTHRPPRAQQGPRESPGPGLQMVGGGPGRHRG